MLNFILDRHSEIPRDLDIGGYGSNDYLKYRLRETDYVYQYLYKGGWKYDMKGYGILKDIREQIRYETQVKDEKSHDQEKFTYHQGKSAEGNWTSGFLNNQATIFKQ